jgi:hypothetical protein
MAGRSKNSFLSIQTNESYISKLRNDFLQQAHDIENKYQNKLRDLREEMELRRKTEIHQIEERKNQQINDLLRHHEKAFSDIKNYYNDITLNNLNLINTLKVKAERVGSFFHAHVFRVTSKRRSKTKSDWRNAWLKWILRTDECVNRFRRRKKRPKNSDDAWKTMRKTKHCLP